MDRHAFIKEITSLQSEFLSETEDEAPENQIRTIRVVYNDNTQEIYNFTNVKFIEVNF